MVKIETLKMVNFEVACRCELFHYGSIMDLCMKFNYEFQKGKIYGIIGEMCTGGWALSYTLAGREKDFDGQILVNGNPVDSTMLKNISCYVGEDDGSRKFLFKKMTIKEHIEQGIKSGKSFDDDVKSIMSKFGLSQERFNRIIERTSGERWKCSIAMGYAKGKLIYCFPWLNTSDINQLKERIEYCIKPLREIEAIVIIPTAKEESLFGIVDQTIKFEGPFERDYESDSN